MNIQIIGLDKVAKDLKKFAEGTALRVAANYVKEQERIQSLAGRDFQGKPFAPYKKSTIADRRRNGYRTDKVTLTRTGALTRSRDYDSTNKELRYGYQEEDVAGYLQDGTRNMKARPFVGVSSLDIPEIEKRVVSALNNL